MKLIAKNRASLLIKTLIFSSVTLAKSTIAESNGQLTLPKDLSSGDILYTWMELSNNIGASRDAAILDLPIITSGKTFNLTDTYAIRESISLSREKNNKSSNDKRGCWTCGTAGACVKTCDEFYVTECENNCVVNFGAGIGGAIGGLVNAMAHFELGGPIGFLLGYGVGYQICLAECKD